MAVLVNSNERNQAMRAATAAGARQHAAGFSIGDAEFERVRSLALRVAGIELHDRHREQLPRRCARLGIEGSAGLARLLGAVEAGDAAAQRRLIALLTTSFTGFFRHPWHFDSAAEHALWKIHRCGTARLWSSAAATGEEPYSLAMALIGLLRRNDPPATILATDINSDALEFAQRGEYGERALRTLDPAVRAQFILEADRQACGRMAPEVRHLVEFRPLNLASSDWPVAGPFDVIFCRNVLMYLEPCRRESAVKRMAALLAPDGLLILDPAEHLGRVQHLFGKGRDGVYSRARPGR